MILRKLTYRRLALLVAGLFFAGLTVGLTVDLAQDYVHPGRTEPMQVKKLEFALRAHLEFKRAEEALRDSIARGDDEDGHNFIRHLDRMHQQVRMYRYWGSPTPQEDYALRILRETLPTYQSAVYAVQQMRIAHASPGQIDRAVQAEEQPMAAAFQELEDATPAPDAFGRALLRESAVVCLCAALAATSIFFAFALPVRFGEQSGARARSLPELSKRILLWQEEKNAKALVALRDRVCQSLSAVMYLLKSAEYRAPGQAGASPSPHLEPIIGSLQNAIRETLAIGHDLHSPGLHESGLLGTLDSVWADCQARRPDLDIVPAMRLKEQDVGEDLKPVIVRIARLAFDWAAQDAATHRLRWDLARERNRVRLSIQVLGGDDAACAGTAGGAGEGAASALPDVIHARILLSGGACDGSRDIPGGRTITATWPLQAVPSAADLPTA